MRDISARNGRHTVTLEDPDTGALIDLVADLFVSSATALPVDESVEQAIVAARAFGHNRGWTTATIRDYELQVARRVAWRLAALRRRG